MPSLDFVQQELGACRPRVLMNHCMQGRHTFAHLYSYSTHAHTQTCVLTQACTCMHQHQAEDHDVPISPKEIVEQGLMSQEDWDKVRELLQSSNCKREVRFGSG